MPNPSVNRINTTIAALDVTAIGTAFTSILTALATYVQTLTDEERASLFSLGEENLVFAQEALTQGQLLNASLPAPMQTIVTNLGNDMTIYGQLNTIAQGNLAQVLQRVSDTRRLAAHEAYSGALGLYKYIEAGAALGLTGFAAAYDILKQRFAGQGGAPTPPTP